MKLQEWIVIAQCTALWVLSYRIIKIWWKQKMRSWFYTNVYVYPDDLEEESRMQQINIIAFCLISFLLFGLTL